MNAFFKNCGEGNLEMHIIFTRNGDIFINVEYAAVYGVGSTSGRL